jgi:uncharacterized protein
MNRQQMTEKSELEIKQVLRTLLPENMPIYLFGSRARHDHRWNSDYDLWVDGDLPRALIISIIEHLDESFVPFKVDIVTTPQLKGRFAERVKKEAVLWM